MRRTPQKQMDEMEVLPSEWTVGNKEPRSWDITWHDSVEGIRWAMNQRPKGRPYPQGTDEAKAILSHLKSMCPDGVMKAWNSAPNVHARLIWDMPFSHTAYVSDVKTYYNWLCNGRPGAHSSRLTEDLLQGDMYQVSLAIAKERQIIRRRAMRNK